MQLVKHGAQIFTLLVTHKLAIQGCSPDTLTSLWNHCMTFNGTAGYGSLQPPLFQEMVI